MNFLKRLFGAGNPRRETEAVHTKRTRIPTAAEVLKCNYRFVAVDVETANSDPGSICQIGFAVIDDLGQTLSFGTLVNPGAHFDRFNVNLHGIDEASVADAPNFPDTMEAFRSFLERHPIVQHSSFDKRAISGACQRYGLPVLNSTWHDSVIMARRAWPELKGNGGHGLANLKEALDLRFEHHDAIEDAKAAAQVVLLAEQKTGKSFQEICAKQSRTRNKFEKPKSVEGNKDGPLFGHVACFTGKLTLSRSEVSTMAAGAGISVKTSVSKKITLLVVGDQDLEVLNGNDKSSKHRKAEELVEQGQDIRIMGEREFLELIRGTQ